MKTLDVGDNAVTWSQPEDEIIVHSIVPHFEGADPVTQEQIEEAVFDYQTGQQEAAESAYWDHKIDEARGH